MAVWTRVPRLLMTFSVAGGILLMSALAASGQDSLASSGGWWLPEDVSLNGPRIDRLFYIILALTGIVFVFVQITLLVFLVKYRRREGKRATYIHGNNRLEIIWTAIPALFLVALIFLSQHAWSAIRPAKTFRGPAQEPDAIVIEVIAQQFAWNVHYPGEDGTFGRRNPANMSSANPIGLDLEDPNAQDDIVTINQLHIPVGRKIQIQLTSKDVIHSFFLPPFRIKQDAVPGMLVNVFFTATKPGMYEIACAELCGLGHYRMRGFLTVHEDEESYREWLASRTPAGAQ